MKNTETPRPPRVFISAAEPSGDMHAASLIREFREIRPETEFVGIAGPKMRAAGCRAVADLTSSAAMLTGVFASAFQAADALRRTTLEFTYCTYDACVVLDSPMLNLPIALRAKMRAIPVLYYIAPQLWAWGAWRVHKVRSRVDKLAVVLPFEENFFRTHGLDATYVGHPLFDVLHARPARSTEVDRIRSNGRPILAILPGSRRHVIREVLPGQLEVARKLCERFHNTHVGISVADESLAGLIQEALARSGARAELYRDANAELLTAADLTLVASGTATLEVAYYGSPMIVMYNGSKLAYHLFARWLITLEHLSLINILADRSRSKDDQNIGEVVPEFMPYYDSTAHIVAKAIELLTSPDRLAAMRAALAETIAPLNHPGASARAARMLDEMINSNQHR